MSDVAITASGSKKRHAEWSLLIGAWLIGAMSWFLVNYATGVAMTNGWLALLATSALFLIAYAVVRMQVPHADPVLLPCVTALNMLGIAMIHRLDIANELHAAGQNAQAPTPDVYLQITWLAIALILFCLVLISVKDHRKLQRFTYTSGIAGVFLLFLPLLPGIGTSINGARLWVEFAGLSFQPGEIAKILLTIFFAGFLVVRRHSLALVNQKIFGIGVPRIKDIGPLVVVWMSAVLVLIVERDLGTSLLLFGVFIVMLYVATGRRGWVIIGALMLLMSGTLAYFAFSHVRVRFSVWLDPFSQATDNGYQIVQSLYGLANGGIFGTGWGRGYPQLVPFAKTDFITSALGEELGLAGMIALLAFYIIAVERGARAAVGTRDPFGNLLAIGLTTVLGLQTFIVMGGVTRLIPLTGLTTPFLSYGGSSLVANYIIVALILRISNAARKIDDKGATQVLVNT